MKKKLIQTEKSTLDKKRKTEYFIGVRFAQHPRHIFTYKVLKPVKLGDELVVDNEFGTAVVIVVRLGKGGVGWLH